MFETVNDESNRRTVSQQERGSLNLVGIAIRGDRKAIDEGLVGLRFHHQL
jgi:hypothetical protein